MVVVACGGRGWSRWDLRRWMRGFGDEWVEGVRVDEEEVVESGVLGVG